MSKATSQAMSEGPRGLRNGFRIHGDRDLGRRHLGKTVICKLKFKLKPLQPCTEVQKGTCSKNRERRHPTETTADWDPESDGRTRGDRDWTSKGKSRTGLKEGKMYIKLMNINNFLWNKVKWQRIHKQCSFKHITLWDVHCLQFWVSEAHSTLLEA